MKSLFEPHINMTAKVMDFRLERQNVVAANLANINTPDYRPLRLEFEKDLQAALNLDVRGKLTKTDPEHIPGAFDPDKSKSTLDQTLTKRLVRSHDEVDLDKEMSIMAKNTMMYNALSTVIKNQMDGLKKVISDGSR